MKYGSARTVCQHGHKHASKREAARCAELHLLFRGGVIDVLVIEPQFWFELDGEVMKHGNGRRIGYKPDFTYIENGKTVAEDVKGGPTNTEAAVLRMAFFRHLFPNIELRVTK